MLALHVAPVVIDSSEKWGKWFFLVMALHALYCMFNPHHRDAVYGEFYKLRFMKRTGAPASGTTALLALLFWALGFVSFFFPRFWDGSYSGVLALGMLATVMLSSFFDARAFRKGNWR